MPLVTCIHCGYADNPIAIIIVKAIKQEIVKHKIFLSILFFTTYPTVTTISKQYIIIQNTPAEDIVGLFPSNTIYIENQLKIVEFSFSPIKTVSDKLTKIKHATAKMK
jgi:hypothetical protein